MVFQQVLVLFILIIVGYVIRKMNLVTDAINKEIGSLVVNIALPAYLIVNMNQPFSVDMLKNSLVFVILSFGVYAGFAVSAKLFSKMLHVEGKAKDVFEYVLLFSNVGYMGYPVVQVVFGQEGVFYTAVYNLSFSVLVWSYGVFLMNRNSDHKEKRKGFLNPGLVAVLIGYALFAFSIKLPGPIEQTLKLIGDTTMPLSMMFIGFILAQTEMKTIFREWRVFAITFIRLVVQPASVWLVLSTFGFKGLLLNIPVLKAAMPAAANTAIIASKYGSDYQLAAKLIYISTLLSVATIPFVVELLV
jgi:hypothetical protein